LTPNERLPGREPPTGSAALDARRVAEEAERAALSLRGAYREGFDSFFVCLAVDEPAIHLMPLHFLYEESRGTVARDSLHQLAVAAKLEYARNRWLDEMVDGDAGASALTLAAHRLNDALLALIESRYARVLDGSVATSFFAMLATLHARHGLSVILDGARTGHAGITFDDYVEHAQARHGPVRAPVDAVLLLADAPEEELQRARLSWHRWALGVQFYDDALDVEEDFRSHSPSWTVSRTLEFFAGRLPDPELFYEMALREGVVSESLVHAESFFAEAARLAERCFPSWAAFQRTCMSRARELREDYEKLVAEAGQA
jgi:hypothetical protein